MSKFQAIATNKIHARFYFDFESDSWENVNDSARKALNKIIENDPIHQHYGPWEIHNIQKDI